jgi:hypothetical protein
VRRWLVAIGLILALILGGVIVLLRVKFEGEDLGQSVTEMINAKMRGRIEIASIEWPSGSIPTLAMGGWVPVTMRGVKVWDGGSPSKLVVDAGLITGEVDIHALLFNQSFVFRHVVVRGGKVLLEQVEEPYPLHHYDKTVISLLSAFEPAHRPGFSTGVFVSGSSIFDLRDFELRDVEVDMHMSPYVTTGLLDGNRDGKPDPITAYTFTATLEHVDARGFLYRDGSDPLVPKLYFALTGVKDQPGLVAAKGSSIHLFDPVDHGEPGYTIPLDSLVIERVAQLPNYWPNVEVANSLEIQATAVSSKGAALRFSGELQDYYDRPYDGQWGIDVAATNLGPTLADTFSARLGGDDVRASFRLRGPYLALPKIDLTMTGLQVEVLKGDTPLLLSFDRIEGEIDNVNDQLKLHQTVARGAGGEVQLAGTVQLRPYLRVDGNVFITKPLDLAPWLPATVAHAVGTRLSGALHAVGYIADRIRFDDFTNLALGGVRFDRRGVITADDYFNQIYFDDVGVNAGRTSATIDGSVDTAEAQLALRVSAQSGDLDAWLRKLGLPALATTGGGTVAITKSWSRPLIVGNVHAGGVPMIDNVAARIALDGDELAIADLGSSGFGGSLTGGGHLRLGGPGGGAVVRDLHLTGKNLDAAKLPGSGGLASGTIDKASIDISGPTSHLSIQGGAIARTVELGGNRYDDVAMCINPSTRRGAQDAMCAAARPRTPEPADDDERAKRAQVATACDAAHEHGGVCVTARADRDGGGTVDVTAVIGKAGSLAGALDIAMMPLSAVLGADATAGGDLTSHVFLGGTTSAPTADGSITLLRGWLARAFLGDVELRVVPAGPGQIGLSGSALQGRVALAATVGTTPPYPARITADLRRVDVDPFVDLRAYLGVADPVRLWVTGQVTIQTELGSAKPPIDATVALSELALTIAQRDADGRPAPVTLSAASPVRLRYHDGGVDLVCVDPQPGAAAHVTPCPVQLRTPAGTIAISGSARPDKLDLAANGRIDAALLRSLLAGYVEESGGSADLDIHVQGTLAAPLVNATLAMNDVWFRPLRQDTVIHLLAGTVGLKNNNDLGFTGMKLTVKDNYSGDFTELDLGGGIKLADWKPKHWGITLDGELPAKLLLALAPESFSNASGVAEVEVWLQGYGAQPAIDGRLSFDAKRPFTLVPRGTRRELSVSEGWMNLVDQVGTGSSGDPCHPPKGDPNAQVGALRHYRVDLCGVGGSIDAEGHLKGVNGSLELVDWKLVGGDVTVARAEGLPFRIPHELDVTLNADSLHLSSDQITHTWDLAGVVEVPSGKYTRDFDFSEVLKPQARAAGSPKPFWEEYPAIGATNLELTLDVRKFSVDDRVATIDMSGQLLISGTPRDPRFDGTIQVGRGEFRLPASRAKFTRTSGSVTFSRLSRFPNETPSLAIQSEADYRDPSGQNHLITLTIDGTLSQLNWNLFTSSGLNKAQTLTLILSGRTPEQFKRQLGNDSVGSDPSHIETSTNPNDSYTDQFIKDVAANFISLLVEDSLKDVSKLDVARLEIGTGSIGFHGEKKVTDTINLLGDLEQTVRGSSVYVRGEWHAPYKFIIQGGWLKKNFDDAAEEDISDVEVKLVYRFFIP